MNISYEYAEEILNGEVFLMSPRPTVSHLEATHNIATIFKRNLRKKGCKVLIEPDVYFIEGEDQVVPDVVVVCDKSLIKKGRIVYGAPNLIVEVLSYSTRNNDRGYKKDLYEKHGVKEYWIVDAKGLEIEVYVLTDGKYRFDKIYDLPRYWELEEMTDEEKAALVYEFTPHEFKDLIIDIREVFEDID